MTLKPCPNPACRREYVAICSDAADEFVQCMNTNCGTRGPRNDPHGEQWNALLRVEDVEAAFRDGEDNDNVARRSNLSNWIFSLTKRDLDRRIGK